MVASVSKTPFTSFFATSFSAAIFSISCDFVIWAAIFKVLSLIRCDGQYLEKASKTILAMICTAFVHPLATFTKLPSNGHRQRRRLRLPPLEVTSAYRSFQLCHPFQFSVLSPRLPNESNRKN